MTLFMVGKQWKSKIYYGIFCFIGFLGMTAADSDSAYLVTGVTFLVLLLLAKGAEEGFYLITLVAIYSVSELFICAFTKDQRSSILSVSAWRDSRDAFRCQDQSCIVCDYADLTFYRKYFMETKERCKSILEMVSGSSC